MHILISYDNADLEADVESGGHLALYAVPADYSDDGLYLAQWSAGELEPVPACASTSAALLLRLAVAEGDDGPVVREEFKAEGVAYA